MDQPDFDEPREWFIDALAIEEDRTDPVNTFNVLTEDGWRVIHTIRNAGQRPYAPEARPPFAWSYVVELLKGGLNRRDFRFRIRHKDTGLIMPCEMVG